MEVADYDVRNESVESGQQLTGQAAVDHPQPQQGARSRWIASRCDRWTDGAGLQRRRLASKDPRPRRLHHPVGVLLVPGQVLDDLLRQLDQRLTDRGRAHRLIQPRPNEVANALKKLIEWESAHEPVLTCELSRSQVKQFIAAPMIIGVE